MMTEMRKIQEAAKFLRARIHGRTDVAVILGSGLSELRFIDSSEVVVPYARIPYFPVPRVEGHKGMLKVGRLNRRTVLILQGRVHYYEGHSLSRVIFPIRVLKALGVSYLIITGAAGALTRSLKPGNLMLVEDHINFMGDNPLRGENLDKLGPRFPDMTSVYDPQGLELAQKSGRHIGLDLKKGVYISVSGPSYETPAEVKMLRLLGGDAVGMSVVPEAITAAHMGMKTLAIIAITNFAAGMQRKRLDHQEVLRMGERVQSKLGCLLRDILLKIR